MKVLSYNVRGLGGFEKRDEVRRLVNDKHPFVVCLQETKLGVFDDFLLKRCGEVRRVGILSNLLLELQVV